MLSDRIQEKLTALKAMAERGTENEALNAMVLLNRLCLKYGIEMEHLGQEEDSPFEEQTLCQERSMPGWKKTLANAVAKGVGAYVYMSRKDNISSLNVVGLPYQMTLVATQFDYLVQCIDRLSQNCQGRSAKNAFKLGAASRIYTRIQDENDPEQHPEYGEGLIFLNHSIHQARNFIQNKLGGGWRTSRSQYSNASAYAEGYNQAGQIGLSRQMGTGKHLSGG